MKRAGGGSDVQSGVSYLSKAKLNVLDQQDDVKSRISNLVSVKSEAQSVAPSKSIAGSIAPSKIKSTVT